MCIISEFLFRIAYLALFMSGEKNIRLSKYRLIFFIFFQSIWTYNFIFYYLILLNNNRKGE